MPQPQIGRASRMCPEPAERVRSLKFRPTTAQSRPRLRHCKSPELAHRPSKAYLFRVSPNGEALGEGHPPSQHSFILQTPLDSPAHPCYGLSITHLHNPIDTRDSHRCGLPPAVPFPPHLARSFQNPGSSATPSSANRRRSQLRNGTERNKTEHFSAKSPFRSAPKGSVGVNKRRSRRDGVGRLTPPTAAAPTGRTRTAARRPRT